jgi:N-acetylglucosamine-6-sulfatase
LTEKALQFLARPRQRPFFLAVSHLAVHAPYLAQHRFHGVLDRHRWPELARTQEDRALKPAFLDCRQTTQDELNRARSGYVELLAGVDESVGRLCRALEANGELAHTLILFTSDNGYFLGEHGLSDKRAAYEESIRVPMLVRYPPWFAQSQLVRGELVLNLDVARTFLEAAGLAPLPNSHGISLRELALGSAHRDRFLYTYYQENATDDERARCTPSIVALRTLERKIVVYPVSEEPVEIYDLVQDRHERRNLILESPHRQALLQALVEESARIGSTLIQPYLLR